MLHFLCDTFHEIFVAFYTGSAIISLVDSMIEKLMRSNNCVRIHNTGIVHN